MERRSNTLGRGSYRGKYGILLPYPTLGQGNYFIPDMYKMCCTHIVTQLQDTISVTTTKMAYVLILQRINSTINMTCYNDNHNPLIPWTVDSCKASVHVK